MPMRTISASPPPRASLKRQEGERRAVIRPEGAAERTSKPNLVPASDREGGCSCLRRGSRCTCKEDAEWLESKRARVPKYTPPHARRAVLQPAAASAQAAPGCSCLRRHGRCSCQADERWLERKRRVVAPYVPPHLKQRQEDLERRRAEIAASDASASEAKKAGPNIRTLARKMEPQLEKKCFRFNPLQVEGSIICEDLEAQCTEQAFRTQGVKGLPLVQSGRYQFEVELLRDSHLAVGWSGAMSQASAWDHQAFGFSSEARAIHNHEVSAYGLPFGKAGDIIGALVEWKESGKAHVSFMLNGKDLGVAFSSEAVPLQPQVTQLASGLPLQLRLRGSEEAPLAFPKASFLPLAEARSGDFCPFSKAVAEASMERAAALITEDQLRGFCVPDAHIVELYDLPEGEASRPRQLMRHLAQLPAAPGNFWVRETEASTALVALRRASHARQLLEITAQGTGDVQARALQHATAASRQRLREWRGEEFRPQANPTAARRLIHGSLQSQMPLAHLIEERNSKRPKLE